MFIVDVISDASFSENFYGLRRASRNSGDRAMSGESVTATAADESVTADTQVTGDKVQHLTRTEKRRSLLFLVSKWSILLCFV